LKLARVKLINRIKSSEDKMVDELTKKVLDLMRKPEHIRNVGVAAHIDHGI